MFPIRQAAKAPVLLIPSVIPIPVRDFKEVMQVHVLYNH